MIKSNNKINNFLIILVFIIPMYYTVLSEELEQEFATLEILTEPPGAQVSINGTNRGVTPILIDSLKTDVFEIQLSLEGYKDCFERLDLTYESYMKLELKLEKIHIENTGSLNVISSPVGAAVIIDKDTIGRTPFLSDTMRTGKYEIKLLKSEYRTYKEKILITDGVTYNVNVELVSKKRIQNIRRVVFGSLTVALSSVALIIPLKAQSAEEDAWNDYMQENLTPQEYEKLYDVYIDKVDNTNKRIKQSYIFYALAGLTGVGFIISIPF